MTLARSLDPATAPRPLRALRDSALRARCALALAAAVQVPLVIWQFRLHGESRPPLPEDAGEGYHRPWTSLEQQYHWLDNVCTLVLLLTAIAFLLWLLQARTAARALPAATQRYQTVWVFLGWVVPVVSLWFPRGITVDIWRSAARAGVEPTRRRTPWYVNVWWALWLLALVPNGGGLFADDQKVRDAVHDSFGTLLLADTVTVAAALCAMLVVRGLTRDQIEAAPARS